MEHMNLVRIRMWKWQAISDIENKDNKDKKIEDLEAFRVNKE